MVRWRPIRYQFGAPHALIVIYWAYWAYWTAWRSASRCCQYGASLSKRPLHNAICGLRCQSYLADSEFPISTNARACACARACARACACAPAEAWLVHGLHVEHGHLQAAPETTQATPTIKSEAERYLELPAEPMTTDVLEWYANNEIKFPALSVMARQYLGVPATSASAERLFLSSASPAATLMTCARKLGLRCSRCSCGRMSTVRSATTAPKCAVARGAHSPITT